MRLCIILLLCITILSGCGYIARKDMEEKQQAAVARMQAGYADCKNRYPEGSRQWVAKQQCDTAAAQAIRPFVSDPDLFDRYQAERVVIAERLQASKMTLAEANQAAADSLSRLTEDEQRRNLSRRSVGAQESAAAAAWQAAQGPDIGPTFVNPGTGRRF